MIFNGVVNSISKLWKGNKGMKLSYNVVIQTLAMIVQGANQVSSILGDGAQFWIASGVGAIQLVIGILAHLSNPDGKTVTMAYDKTIKKSVSA